MIASVTFCRKEKSMEIIGTILRSTFIVRAALAMSVMPATADTLAVAMPNLPQDQVVVTTGKTEATPKFNCGDRSTFTFTFLRYGILIGLGDETRQGIYWTNEPGPGARFSDLVNVGQCVVGGIIYYVYDGK